MGSQTLTHLLNKKLRSHRKGLPTSTCIALSQGIKTNYLWWLVVYWKGHNQLAVAPYCMGVWKAPQCTNPMSAKQCLWSQGTVHVENITPTFWTFFQTWVCGTAVVQIERLLPGNRWLLLKWKATYEKGWVCTHISSDTLCRFAPKWQLCCN